MSLREMERIIGRAIISDAFREGLLGDRRAELLKYFYLSKEELEFLLKIRADTFVEFSQAVNDFRENPEGNFSPPKKK